MLERRHRLTSSAGFSRATRGGRRAGTRTLVLHLAPLVESAGGDVEQAGPRVGFVVSRAVGNAVARNRVKRRLRHLVRERLTVLPDASAVVVRALPAAASATYDALGRDLDGALRRLDPAERSGEGTTVRTGRGR